MSTANTVERHNHAVHLIELYAENNRDQYDLLTDARKIIAADMDNEKQIPAAKRLIRRAITKSMSLMRHDYDEKHKLIGLSKTVLRFDALNSIYSGLKNEEMISRRPFIG